MGPSVTVGIGQSVAVRRNWSVTVDAAGLLAYIVFDDEVGAAPARTVAEGFVAVALDSRHVPVNVATVGLVRTRTRTARRITVRFWFQPLAGLAWALRIRKRSFLC